MVFNKNIPQPNDLLSQSQQDLLNNNLALNTSFGINHYSFDDLTINNGKHNFVEMPVRSVIPPGLIASEGSLYSKSAISTSPSTETNLFYTPDASSNEYQLTRTVTGKFVSLFGGLLNNYPASDGSGNVGVQYSAGWTFLPGGLLYVYGIYDAGGGGISPSTGTIKFPISFTNAPFVITPVLICKAGGTGSVHTVSVITGTVTTTEFQWNLDTSTSSQTGIYWIAIGK